MHNFAYTSSTYAYIHIRLLVIHSYNALNKNDNI